MPDPPVEWPWEPHHPEPEPPGQTPLYPAGPLPSGGPPEAPGGPDGLAPPPVPPLATGGPPGGSPGLWDVPVEEGAASGAAMDMGGWGDAGELDPYGDPWAAAGGPPRQPPAGWDQDSEDWDQDSEDWDGDGDVSHSRWASYPGSPSGPPPTDTPPGPDLDPRLPASLQDPQCPPAVLAQAASHANQYVRVQAAQHPACPPAVLVQLVRDPSHVVRWAVWCRPDLDPQVLQGVEPEQLPLEEKYLLGASPACPIGLLRRWRTMRPGDQTVTLLLALHPDCTSADREELVRDLSSSVRVQLARASYHVQVLQQLARDPDLAAHLVCNRWCPQQVLRELGDHPDPQVRVQLAKHRNTPVDVLVRLARDADSQVAAHARRHPGLTEQHRLLGQL